MVSGCVESKAIYEGGEVADADHDLMITQLAQSCAKNATKQYFDHVI